MPDFSNIALAQIEQSQSQKEVTANAAIERLALHTGALLLDVSAGGTFNLSEDQASRGFIRLFGTAASAVTVVIPSDFNKTVMFANEITNNNTRVEAKVGSGGTARQIARGNLVLVWSGGFEVFKREARLVITMGSDADYTTSADERTAETLAVVSSVSLTATRNFILDLVPGKTYLVLNATTGGQSLTFKGATGAGVTVPVGATVLIQSNGTDYNVAQTYFYFPVLDGTIGVRGFIRGDSQPLSFTRAVQAMADANQTPLAAVYQARHIECTGALTAQRDLILPTVDGAEHIVENQTTGGFGIQVKTSAGTGIVIAMGRVAIVRCNGTNIRRVTADVDPTV